MCEEFPLKCEKWAQDLSQLGALTTWHHVLLDQMAGDLHYMCVVSAARPKRMYWARITSKIFKILHDGRYLDDLDRLTAIRQETFGQRVVSFKSISPHVV